MKQNDEPESYDQLRERFGPVRIPYEELLATREWRDRRRSVIDRDGWKCSLCGTPPTENVHGQHCWAIEPVFEVVDRGEGRPRDVYMVEGESWESADRAYVLQVHHKYYITGRLPWDYRDDALVTLCQWCHQQVHENARIHVYADANGQLIEAGFATPCLRCGGSGYLLEFHYVEGGVCFRCRGEGVELTF